MAGNVTLIAKKPSARGVRPRHHRRNLPSIVFFLRGALFSRQPIRDGTIRRMIVKEHRETIIARPDAGRLCADDQAERGQFGPRNIGPALADYTRRGCTLDPQETRHRTYLDVFLR